MRKFDAVIIGGGIIGCTIACELRKEKQKVAVIEKGLPGAEASTAAAGMLAPHAGPRLKTPFFNLLREGLASYPQFVQEVEVETGLETEFRNSGLFYLAFDEDDEKKLEEKLAWQRSSNVEAEWVSGSEIRKKEPLVGANAKRGLYFPEDCQIDNVKLMKAIHVWAKKIGVEFLLGNPVTKILIEGERVQGISIGKDRVESPIVINAAGCWADFDRNLPFEIPVKPARGQIVVLQHRTALFSHMLYTRRIYMVTRTDGRIIVGSTVESVGYDKNVTVKGLHKLVRGVIDINPDLGFLAFRESWAGLRPRSKDNLPILGKSPIEGLFLATGHFRNGILLGPLTAQILSRLVLGKKVEHDITPFEISRFLNQNPAREGVLR